MPCPAGKILNPKTGRCVNRNGAIGKALLAKPAKRKRKRTAKKKSSCPAGKILNPKTGRCVNRNGAVGKALLAKSARTAKKKSSCPVGKILNPKTGRCVNKNGIIGKALLAKPAKKRTVKSKPTKKKAVNFIKYGDDVYVPRFEGRDMTWKQFFAKKDFDNLHKLLRQKKNYRLEFITSKKVMTKEWAAFLYMIFDENLSNIPNYLPFENHINKCKGNATSFKNLSEDCTLIIPCNIQENYSTIKNFANHASSKEFNDLWNEVSKHLTQGAAWVSIHGHGVNWLHVRICNKPKYMTQNRGFATIGY